MLLEGLSRFWVDIGRVVALWRGSRKEMARRMVDEREAC